jgi:NAD(P)-dependent dehydrogenase (short-subunit alcohol dehydrogenase family)
VLANHGARVLIGSRNPDRGRAALEAVSAVATGPRPAIVTVDVASLESVAAAAENVQAATDGRLDLLVNNAGILAPPLRFTADGFESQWATNVLGPAALTWRLLPALESTPRSRVVFVSSIEHRAASLDEARIRADVRGENYRGFGYYRRTKLADLLLSAELERHFRRVGVDSIAVAAHPGITATSIVDGGFASLPQRFTPIANWGMRLVGQPVSIGALPILYAATAHDVHGLDYFGPRGPGETRGYPHRSQSSRESRDEQAASVLVKVVSSLIGVPAPL